MIRSLTASSLAAAALGFAWLCPAQAHAQACETDADCAQGLVCEVVGAIACAVPDCPPGEECPEPEPCEPEEFSECVPGPCTSDADCGEGLKCLSVSSETCTGSAMACDPDDEECVVVEVEPVCETVTEQYCAPDWVGECEADADCGEGFTCVAAEICECSSGERSDEAEPGVEVDPAPDSEAEPAPDPEAEPAPDPDAVPEQEPEPVPEPICECYPTGEKYCEPKEVACESAADCPEGWTCEQVGAVAVACTVPDDGSEPVCEPAEDPVYQCMPPYWEMVRGAAGGIDESSALQGDPTSAGPGAEDPDGETWAGEESGGAEEEPTESTPGDEPSVTEDADAESSSGDEPSVTDEPSGSDDEPAASAPAGERSEDEGGCQMSAGSPGSLLALWALGLIGAALRRRRS
jgi:MYXO-CTERM domain-containing protein